MKEGEAALLTLYRLTAIFCFFICIVNVVDNEKKGKDTLGNIVAACTAGVMFLLSYNIK